MEHALMCAYALAVHGNSGMQLNKKRIRVFCQKRQVCKSGSRTFESVSRLQGINISLFNRFIQSHGGLLFVCLFVAGRLLVLLLVLVVDFFLLLFVGRRGGRGIVIIRVVGR